MRRIVRAGLVAAAAAAISGCWVRSLHPLYKATDTDSSPELIGTWQDAEGRQTVIIERGGKVGYRIVYLDGDKPAVFRGRLVQLGDSTYMDVEIAGVASENRLYAFTLIGGHSIFRIDTRGETLSYSSMDYAVLEQGLKSGQLRLKYETVGSGSDDPKAPAGVVIITAPTDELRWFLTSEKRDALFTKPVELKKIR